MDAEYIALAIVSTLAIGGGLWVLHEAKKYRAYRDEQLASAPIKRRHWASTAKMKGMGRASR